MEVEFIADALDRLETDVAASRAYEPAVVRGYRKVLQAIRAATDERDLYQLRGLRFEKLQGKRAHQHSLRLNDRWRLIVELRGRAPNKKVYVVEIADYH